jgi:hypothetical protein
VVEGIEANFDHLAADEVGDEDTVRGGLRGGGHLGWGWFAWWLRYDYCLALRFGGVRYGDCGRDDVDSQLQIVVEMMRIGSSNDKEPLQAPGLQALKYPIPRRPDDSQSKNARTRYGRYRRYPALVPRGSARSA